MARKLPHTATGGQESIMIAMLSGWLLMTAIALGLARSLPLKSAVLAWAIFLVVACALSAWALMSQPVGEPTTAGRIGSITLSWGFRAGQGQLLPAVAISWLAWFVIGGSAILIYGLRGDRQTALMILVWAINVLELMYLIGVMLTNRRAPVSLLQITAVVAGVLIISAFLWIGGSPERQRRALLLAGGPTLLVGVGYGLFVLVMLTAGRNARWN